MSKEIASVYFHINNGGVTFKVLDEGWGPTIEVSSSHFGNNVSSQKVHITKQGLHALARLFEHAADKSYSEPYCCAADSPTGKPFFVFEDIIPPKEYCSTGSCCQSEDDGEEAAEGEGQDVGLDDWVNEEPSELASDLHYAHQFVQNETHYIDESDETCVLKFEHKPYCSGTVTGRVYAQDGELLQTFIEQVSGKVQFTPVPNKSENFCLADEAECKNSKMRIRWHGDPKGQKVLIDYEYDADAERKLNERA